MTGYLEDYKGQRYKLPLFLSWEVTHTDGKSGTDSFEVCCSYETAMREALEDAVHFELIHEDKTVFYGVLDEYEVSISQKGKTVTLRGRGMGAYLLDNKCVGAEYVSCTLSDILRNYVAPFGVELGKSDAMPPMYGYTVSTNASCMTALTGYTQFSAGVTPRFSREGKLMLTKSTGDRFKLNTDAASEIALRSRRYGVLSEVKVITVSGVQSIAKNEFFLERGGCAAAVVTVPKTTGWDMIRYTGSYQIEKSMEGRYALEAAVPELFPAFPGDICEIGDDFCESGTYTVTETCCFGDENGFGTRVYLTKEEE